MWSGCHPVGILAVRTLSLVVVLSSCGPAVPAGGFGATDSADDGTGTAADATSTAAVGTRTADDGTSTAADATSTEADPWDPTSGCDPAFDTGLATGAVVWTYEFRAYAELYGYYGRALSVAVDASGLVYAVGVQRFPDKNDEGWLHALTADGELRWEVRHDQGTFEDRFADVTVGRLGEVIVAGYEMYSAPVAVVIAYSPSGEEVWRTEFASSSGGRVSANPDGRIVLAATSLPQQPGTSATLFLADIGAKGELIERWDPSPDPYPSLYGDDVRFDDAGNLYVLATGPVGDVPQSVEWLGRWDAAGSFLGAITYEHEDAGGVAVNPRGGGALVLGNGSDFAFRSSLRRYDANGVELWARTMEVEAETSLQPLALATDCDGQTLVAAFDNNDAVWLFRFDDRGDERNRLQLETDEGWRLLAMDVDRFGNPVFVGASSNADVYSFVVRKYAR